MSAELLKAAMNDAGVDVDELADRIQVDVRTVRRWVNGGIPYARHRTRVARALDTTARDLWPEAHPLQPDSDRDTSDDDDANGPDLAGVFGSGDVVAVYHGRDDPRVPGWEELLDRAQTRVDLVDLTLHDIIDPDTVRRLAGKAAAGCEVRILVSDPDSAHLLVVESEARDDLTITDLPSLVWQVQRTIGYLQPLLGSDHVDVRAFVAERSHSILRGDDEMLVTLHLYGSPPHLQPVLHLQRRDKNGLFDRLAHHVDLIASHAATPLTADAETYPDPDQNPDRYEPEDPTHSTVRPAGLGRVYDATQTPSTAPTRWWRGRH